MSTNLQFLALVIAGAVAIVSAMLHGVIMQRQIVAPLETLMDSSGSLKGVRQALVAPLLHVSTMSWLVNGLALIAVALWFGHEARVLVGCLAGIQYLYAAGANMWATRGRHPGGYLLALVVVLILAGLA